jgi:hypothetical protein
MGMGKGKDGRIMIVGLGLLASSWLGCQQAGLGGGDGASDAESKSKALAKSGAAPSGVENSDTAQDPSRLANAPVPDESAIQDLVAKDQGKAGSGAIYVSLAHLAKGGKGTQDLEVYRFGVTKILNSLSMKPEIKRLAPLDEGKTVYRVNLADFGLTANDLNTMKRMPGSANAVKRVGNADVIKGDWLVFAATRPEAYDSIMSLPNFVGILESELRIDRSKAVNWYVNASNVTFEKRRLERIPINIGGKPGGYYWRSYDYLAFLVAGEFFFSLPNGLQGYMLSGFAEQHRLDARSDVATDFNRPQDGLKRCVGGKQACGYVINGESCITCHANGVRINDTITSIKGASTEEANRLYAQDAKRFKSEINEMGFADQGEEPVLATLRRYKADNNVKDFRPQGSEISPTAGRGVTSRLR